VSGVTKMNACYTKQQVFVGSRHADEVKSSLCLFGTHTQPSAAIQKGALANLRLSELAVPFASLRACHRSLQDWIGINSATMLACEHPQHSHGKKDIRPLLHSSIVQSNPLMGAKMPQSTSSPGQQRGGISCLQHI
jgi:hypothetical protein